MTHPTDQLSVALEGRYRIERRLGQGGMAIVYLAQDLKHHRQVAIKILRPELAAALGPHRFLREIEIAARLTHPNILPLLDSGDADGSLFYVMPYVEGESLRARLTREGPLPVEEAVKLAQRVAAALSHAHRMGVVHRDIKPENILLSAGEPVVADFGIAKALSAAGDTRLTESGLAVGTAAYMSPEQASGQDPVDGRSDLYALGCVLYETLAGSPPFLGPTVQAITARKLTEPPPSLLSLRETVPAALEQVVRKALARLPADRYATGQQLAEALELVRTSGATPATPIPVVTTRSARWPSRLPWALAAGLAVASVRLGWLALHGRDATVPVHLSVLTPAGTEVTGWWSALALSPDGTTLVFSAGHGDSVRLYARRLDSFESRALPGTGGGDSPFFSPDGRWVGFFARKARQLRKVALAGGSSVLIAEDLALNPESGVWSPADTIYFENYPDQQVSKVAARGGPVTAVTHGVPPNGWFRNPEGMLPDGRHLLVLVTGSSTTHLDAVSLETGEHRLLVDDALGGTVIDGRYLLYVPSGRTEAVAVPFDARRLRVTGDPVTVLDTIAGPGRSNAFSVAPNGTLAYVSLAAPVGWNEVPQLVLVGRDGAPEGRALPHGRGPRFSPDGRRLVYLRLSRHGPDIFVFDLERGVERRLTGDASNDMWPAFSADGRQVVFNSDRDHTAHLVLYETPTDGSGHPVRLGTDTMMHQQPFTWAAHGTELLYTRGPAATGMDIWAVSLTGSSSRALLQTAANETQPAMSPDGQWLAYTTDASGRPEVMVRRYPDGPDVQVSHEGGLEPAWDRLGRTIYFRDLGWTSVMAAAFQPGDPPRIAAPEALFTAPYGRCNIWCRSYDVSPDGRRFVMERPATRFSETGYWPAGREIRIMTHWDRELRARLQAAGR